MKQNKYDILRRYFGCSTFRKGQEPLIDAVLSGRDVLGILPTGGGKSFCYQIPALMLPGITLVISPLISLMNDQIRTLKMRGIPAEAVTSASSREMRTRVLENAVRGKVKLLYLAPERLKSREFLRIAGHLKISMICVDEAHCVSKWGRGFRPDYLGIGGFAETLAFRPVMAAFTATAAPAVREDIVRLLGLRNPFVLVSGFDRPNLYYGVLHPKNKYDMLKTLLSVRRDVPGIIYCDTRQTTETVADKLAADGIPVLPYHAGFSAEEREKAEEYFLSGKARLLAATCAFGMGIDKPDVRFVIHYNMPGDPESYYQEAGRAGRDGLRSECILLADHRDVELRMRFIHEMKNPMLRQMMLADLAEMRRIASGKLCIRHAILKSFGEDSPSRCGNCSFCTGNTDSREASSDELLKALTSLRLRISKEKKILPFRIFSDGNLRDMAERRPENLMDLLCIEGISAISAIKYGADFIAEIRAYLTYSL